MHYSQKQFHPLNTCPLGKLQYHPPGTPPTEDAVRVFISPPLYFQIGHMLCAQERSKRLKERHHTKYYNRLSFHIINLHNNKNFLRFKGILLYLTMERQVYNPHCCYRTKQYPKPSVIRCHICSTSGAKIRKVCTNREYYRQILSFE